MSGYKFVGGSLCLDFVNTVGGRARSTTLRDKFGDYGDLTSWAVPAKALTAASARKVREMAGANPRRAETVFHRAIALREALYRIFRSALENRRPGAKDIAIVNRELKRARARENLAWADGRFRWTAGGEPLALEAVLRPVAISAGELLASGDLSRLRQCGGADCGWLFLDTTRNRSRRWCDMKDCGNRAKVRRFRQRR